MLTAGTVMIFTPGPGLLAIAGGLALMKDDVAWAGRAADWVKEKASRVQTPRREEVETSTGVTAVPVDEAP